MTIICYSRCGTCKKAIKWLQERGSDFTQRSITEETPTREELAAWQQKSGLPLQKFFNTSGRIYKENHLKDKLPAMSDEEKLDLLSSDGMLIKRPILLADDGSVLVGFKEAQWESLNG